MSNNAYGIGNSTMNLDEAFEAFKKCPFAVNHLGDGTTTPKWRDSCMETKTFDVNFGVNVEGLPGSCQNKTTFEKHFVRFVDSARFTDSSGNAIAETAGLLTESELTFMVYDLLCDNLCSGCAVPLTWTEVTDFTTFNSVFEAGGGVLERRCTTCSSDYQSIFYKRTSGFPANKDWATLFRQDWFSHENVLGTDFELYSSEADMNAGLNAWQFCNYDDTGIGFPRDCGITGFVGNQWNSLYRGGHTVSWWMPQ